MKTTIKKTMFIFISMLALTLNSASCSANENFTFSIGSDYLVTTAKSIKANIVPDQKILTLSPFYTIYNEKNVLLIHPQKVGKTSITIVFDDKAVIIDATVKQNEKTSTPNSLQKSDFEIIQLDAPPSVKNEEEDFELDAPPVNMEDK